MLQRCAAPVSDPEPGWRVRYQRGRSQSLTMLAAIGLLLVAVTSTAYAQSCEPETFVVAVDVGHTRAAGGAVSARGVPEYAFNIRLAREFLQGLHTAGYGRSFVVDDTGSEITLRERSRRATARSAQLFISIHHDSMQTQYLKPWIHDGVTRRYSEKFSGHSIFISDEVVAAHSNLRIAKALGRALMARNLVPTLHHAEPIDGENRALLDAKLGVYSFPQLYVLRAAKYPALLFEAGIILNPNDEARLNTVTHRTALVESLLEAVAVACRDAQAPRK